MLSIWSRLKFCRLIKSSMMLNKQMLSSYPGRLQTHLSGNLSSGNSSTVNESKIQVSGKGKATCY